jgi:hypothetical protein
MAVITVIQVVAVFVRIVASLAMMRRIVSNSKKDSQPTMPVQIAAILIGKLWLTRCHFTATASNERTSEDIWVCDGGAIGHYSMSMGRMFNVQDINEKIHGQKHQQNDSRGWKALTSCHSNC